MAQWAVLMTVSYCSCWQCISIRNMIPFIYHEVLSQLACQYTTVPTTAAELTDVMWGAVWCDVMWCGWQWCVLTASLMIIISCTLNSLETEIFSEPYVQHVLPVPVMSSDECWCYVLYWCRVLVVSRLWSCCWPVWDIIIMRSVDQSQLHSLVDWHVNVTCRMLTQWPLSCC